MVSGGRGSQPRGALGDLLGQGGSPVPNLEQQARRTVATPNNPSSNTVARPATPQPRTPRPRRTPATPNPTRNPTRDVISTALDMDLARGFPAGFELPNDVAVRVRNVKDTFGNEEAEAYMLEKMVPLLLSGADVLAIARLFNVTPATVRRLAKLATTRAVDAMHPSKASELLGRSLATFNHARQESLKTYDALKAEPIATSAVSRLYSLKVAMDAERNVLKALQAGTTGLNVNASQHNATKADEFREAMMSIADALEDVLGEEIPQDTAQETP